MGFNVHILKIYTIIHTDFDELFYDDQDKIITGRNGLVFGNQKSHHQDVKEQDILHSLNTPLAY